MLHFVWTKKKQKILGQIKLLQFVSFIYFMCVSIFVDTIKFLASGRHSTTSITDLCLYPKVRLVEPGSLFGNFKNYCEIKSMRFI